jgi:protochlorophyllide reductase
MDQLRRGTTLIGRRNREFIVTAIFVLTGATSGLGLEAARLLAKRPDALLLAGARQPDRAAALRALGACVRVGRLDLEEGASVAAFADWVAGQIGGQRINGLMLNAGLQLVGPLERTASGVERTFAANHLGHFMLAHLLLDHLAPGAPVVSTSSGTHDPADTLARRFGFRGGVFPNATAVAGGDLDAGSSAAQAGLDRYATSKLCNILFTLEMSRRVTPARARFVAIDPGLMPGTGLARGRSALLRFGWSYVMPALRFVAREVSSARRSGEALARLVAAQAHGERTGLYVDVNLAERTPSAAALNSAFAKDLYDVSARLCGLTALTTASAAEAGSA